MSNRFAFCVGGIFNFDYVIFPSPSTTEPGVMTYNNFFERVRWDHYRRPPREWRVISVKDDHKRVDAWYRPIPPFDITKDPCGTWLHFGDLPLNGKKGIIKTLQVTTPLRDGLPIFKLTEGGILVPVTTTAEDGSESMAAMEFEIATTLLYEEVLEQSGRSRCPTVTTGNGEGGEGSGAPPPPPPSTPSTPSTTTASTLLDSTVVTASPNGFSFSIATPTPTPTPPPPPPPPSNAQKHKSNGVVTVEDGPTPSKRRYKDSGFGESYSGQLDVTEPASCEDGCQDDNSMMVSGSPSSSPPPSNANGRRHHHSDHLQFEELASMIDALHLPDQTRRALQPSINNLRDLLLCKIERIEKTVNSMNGANRQSFRTVIDSVARVSTQIEGSNGDSGANNGWVSSGRSASAGSDEGGNSYSVTTNVGGHQQQQQRSRTLVQTKLSASSLSGRGGQRSRSAGRLGGPSGSSQGSSQESCGPFLTCNGGDDDELEIVNHFNPVPPSPPRYQSNNSSNSNSNPNNNHHQQQQQQQRRLPSTSSSPNTLTTHQNQQQQTGGAGGRSLGNNKGSSNSSGPMHKYLSGWGSGGGANNNSGDDGSTVTTANTKGYFTSNNRARRGGGRRGGGGVGKR